MRDRIEKYPTVICSECGKEEKATFGGTVGKLMVEKCLCFECAFWTEKIEIFSNRHAIIDGKMFYIKDDKPKEYKGFLGFGGRKFNIQFNDGQIITTRNMWHNGEIPDHFRDRLPDNAVFISEKELTETNDTRLMAGDSEHGK